VGLGQKVPACLRKTSSYAERGTSLHAVMTRLIADDTLALEGFAGKTIENYTVTSEDVETAVRPALAYVDELLDRPGAEFYLEHHRRPAHRE
jgi:hypothetical protein